MFNLEQRGLARRGSGGWRPGIWGPAMRGENRCPGGLRVRCRGSHDGLDGARQRCQEIVRIGPILAAVLVIGVNLISNVRHRFELIGQHHCRDYVYTKQAVNARQTKGLHLHGEARGCGK